MDRERERGREREKEKERKRKKEREREREKGYKSYVNQTDKVKYPESSILFSLSLDSD